MSPPDPAAAAASLPDLTATGHVPARGRGCGADGACGRLEPRESQRRRCCAREAAEGDERGDIVGGENGAEGGREPAERDNSVGCGGKDKVE